MPVILNSFSFDSTLLPRGCHEPICKRYRTDSVTKDKLCEFMSSNKNFRIAETFKKLFLLLLLAFDSYSSLKVMSCLLWSFQMEVMSAQCNYCMVSTWSVNIIVSSPFVLYLRKRNCFSPEYSHPEFTWTN